MTAYFTDPVCGMPVADARRGVVHLGQEVRFCSERCQEAFLATPERYVRDPAGAVDSARGDLLSSRIAYFSMEIALDRRMPTYAGGLGVLAGDTLRSAADLGMPLVGVTLVHREGYLRQRLDSDGRQREEAVPWQPESMLLALEPRAHIEIEGRSVAIRAWRFDVRGHSTRTVPVLLLDTDLPENSPADRAITSQLYGGDDALRLAQEIVLGIGGLRMLRALGVSEPRRFHLNEGHAALLAVELLRSGRFGGSEDWPFQLVRDRCVFTTHTPVPAGHDQFDYRLVKRVAGELLPDDVLRMLGGRERLNMTLLALNLSGQVNGVAKRHGIVSQEMFPGYPIDSVTNGVHSLTWTSLPFRALFDRFVPGWTNDPFSLRRAVAIPSTDLWNAHEAAKQDLFTEVARRRGIVLDPAAFTVGFARRATLYKRAELIFQDPSRLAAVAAAETLQLVFAGKAHPRDEEGKEMIRRVVLAARGLGDAVRFVWLEDYDIDIAAQMTAGVDLWLNTPRPPLEASGTSGMKAAHNGVPSLSVLDGWWIEGHIEGVTGWSIGPGPGEPSDEAAEARDLYDKLEMILRLHRTDRDGWTSVMRHSIALNASFFNTHRMLQQYASLAYT